MKEMRVFIAIELGRELQNNLLILKERLERQVPYRSVRWVRPEGIHLTLKFLGDVPAARIAAISQALEMACRGLTPFTCELSGLGCFPNPRRPRVLWVGVHEPSGTLKGLHKAVERELAAIGFAPENRPFSPHLTLGRVQRKAGRSDRDILGEVIARSSVGLVGRLTVSEVNVIRSELRPSGAVYTALARVPLED